MSEVTEKPCLQIFIQGKQYLVTRIPFEGENPAYTGWKLTPRADPFKVGSYNVICHKASRRITCECGDYSFVKHKTGDTCKHIERLVELFGKTLGGIHVD